MMAEHDRILQIRMAEGDVHIKQEVTDEEKMMQALQTNANAASLEDAENPFDRAK